MNSEKTIHTIREILTEPHLKQDAGGFASRMLPIFILILSITGLITSAFFTSQYSSLTATLTGSSTLLKGIDRQIETALSGFGTSTMNPSQTVLAPKQIESLKNILNANRTAIDAVPVQQAEELQRETTMSFKFNALVGGVLTLALMSLLLWDFGRGLRYRNRIKGSDEGAFRVYDGVITGSDFSRKAIEEITVREAGRFLGILRDVKIARICYLFQATRQSVNSTCRSPDPVSDPVIRTRANGSESVA